MISKSQNKEDIAIQNYFSDFVGTCLSIGENDGETLSNVYALIKKGWEATLVEPAPQAFGKMSLLHAGNERVYCINAAIGDENGEVDFFDSGSHLSENDHSLLSSVSLQETVKWRKTTEFKQIKVQMKTFDKVLEESPYKKFQFISIDAESFDIPILRQMNLTELGCVCLCIEHNGVKANFDEIKRLCGWYGLDKLIVNNSENAIYTI